MGPTQSGKIRERDRGGGESVGKGELKLIFMDVTDYMDQREIADKLSELAKCLSKLLVQYEKFCPYAPVTVKVIFSKK